MRPPKWIRDEIIIALDFYQRYFPDIPEKESQEISDLSKKLRSIRVKLGDSITSQYRNVNGVYMKLMNFHAINPDFQGRGLDRYSQLDKEIFEEFSEDISGLRTLAESILLLVENENIQMQESQDEDSNDVFEGRVLSRFHKYRERDRGIVKKKKDSVLNRSGELRCEACGFSFKDKYGDRGSNFIECHHTKPISEISAGEKTKLSDLALVCSNCHRMIHAKKPWLSVAELQSILSG